MMPALLTDGTKPINAMIPKVTASRTAAVCRRCSPTHDNSMVTMAAMAAKCVPEKVRIWVMPVF